MSKKNMPLDTRQKIACDHLAHHEFMNDLNKDTGGTSQPFFYKAVEVFENNAKGNWTD
jgi:hypothetical protein